MPSVRPRLVQEGVPIGGGGGGSENRNHGGDVPMMEGDNRFVIGGGGTHQQLSSSSSSPGGTAGSLVNASSGSLAKEPKKRTSSLAKASSLVSAASARKGHATTAAKSSVIQTSYVIGGTLNEKKSTDSPYGGSSSMMVDDPPRKNRTSLTETSFEIPGGGSSYEHNNGHNSTMNDSASSMHIDPPPPMATKFVVQPTHSALALNHVVGDLPQAAPAVQHHHHVATATASATHHDGVEKMEGVIDLSIKPPMCVLDGANIAYAYSKIAQGATSLQASNNHTSGKAEPDANGIVVACHYFLSAGIRVLAVVPSTWLHREPHQSILHKLNQQGLLVPAPPRDDDDAYALTIARREDQRAQQRGDGPGYVVSNDMFRDAIAREETDGNNSAQLREWLNDGRTLALGKTGPGRISYSFANTGAMDDHGDKVLDLLPNPRHPLVQFVEEHRAANS